MQQDLLAHSSDASLEVSACNTVLSTGRLRLPRRLARLARQESSSRLFQRFCPSLSHSSPSLLSSFHLLQQSDCFLQISLRISRFDPLRPPTCTCQPRGFTAPRRPLCPETSVPRPDSGHQNSSQHCVRSAGSLTAALAELSPLPTTGLADRLLSQTSDTRSSTTGLHFKSAAKEAKRELSRRRSQSYQPAGTSCPPLYAPQTVLGSIGPRPLDKGGAKLLCLLAAAEPSSCRPFHTCHILCPRPATGAQQTRALQAATPHATFTRSESRKASSPGSTLPAVSTKCRSAKLLVLHSPPRSALRNLFPILSHAAPRLRNLAIGRERA